MKAQPASNATRIERARQLSAIPLASGLMLLTSFACSGTTAFKDTTPIRIAAATAAEPEPEPVAAAPAEKRVSIRDNTVSVSDTIQFSYDGARVLEDAFQTLESVAQVIKDNPHVKKVRIEGHASEEGTEQHNQRLSTLRAKAVRTYLIARGVPARRLATKGFGESNPIADNDSESGREQNRRVEFNILSQDITRERIETDPETGEERVLETLND